jgi:hypothetical protein
MRTFHRLAIGSVTALMAACTTNREPAVSARTPEVPVGTIREVMKGIVEGSSQALFDSVAITSSAAGTIQKEPSTPEEWTALEHRALQLAEAPNLLKVPGRRVARPEEENTRSGPRAHADPDPSEARRVPGAVRQVRRRSAEGRPGSTRGGERQECAGVV